MDKNEKEVPWLTPEKKKLFKSLKGKATSPIDLNKMREEYKYEDSKGDEEDEK